MTIGERIKFRREELKLTQQELADRVGYKGKTAISKIEAGERDLRQSMIRPMATALETSVDFIMGWDDEVDMCPVQLSDSERKLLKLYNNLNQEGQEKVLEFAQLLDNSGAYNICDQHELLEKKA